MGKNRLDEKNPDAIDMYACVLKECIDAMNSLDLSVIDPSEIDKVQGYSDMFNLNKKVTKENIRSLRGQVLLNAHKQLKSLAVEHVLERVIEDDTGRLPKKSRAERTHTDYEEF
jgi:hypothetical protein